MSRRWLWFILPLALVVIALAGLWLARARLAAQLARTYFQQQGIASDITFDRLGMAGLSGRIALGPADAPDFSARAMEVDFDPLSWTPRVVAVRLLDPVVRASITPDGAVHLGSLQAWLDQLSKQSGHSDYVSDDLTVSLSHLTALLVTPAGAVALTGDAALRHNALLSATLALQPASLSWQGTALKATAGSLTLKAIPNGYAADATLKGDISGNGETLNGASLDLFAPQLVLAGGKISSPHITIRLTAASSAGALASINPALQITADDVQVAGSDVRLHLQLHGGADFSPPSLTALYPVLARDPVLAPAVSANLKHLDLSLDADAARDANGFQFALRHPLTVTGARQGRLTVTTFNIAGPAGALAGSLDATLTGPGLPALHLASRNVALKSGALSGDAALSARFDFAMLHKAAFDAAGRFAYANGALSYTLKACTLVTLAAFHPGDGDMATDIKATLCPAADALFTMDAKGWRLHATAKTAAMAIPLATASLSDGAGDITFTGKGNDISGKIAVSAAKLTDHVKPARFETLTGTGDISLKNWVWSGGLALGDANHDPLGSVTFDHTLATGSGGLVISAPAAFAPGKLQPRMLSSLLGKLTKAQGAVDFEGAVNWTPRGFDSNGTLKMDELDFLTPLGTAHALNATLHFTSLLPPATAPHQHIAISKLDWALPINSIGLDFTFGGGKLAVENLGAGISEGNAKLGGLTLDFAKPGTVSGAASLDGLSLAPMVAAFNLGDQIKLQGKVSGSVPFTMGPEGFRIHDGHLAALGTGRIALDPSLWSQGDTVPMNAVQNLAYQALANLAFTSLTADINSVPDGRLQVVFHIIGASDPPKPQKAEIAIADVINGTALQKNIDLPGGTPIDLTLDTSLNFDELLKSYADTWSNALSATPEPQ